MREIHTLAIFVHGALSGLHLLGTVYNVRRRNWVDVSAHLFAMVYSTRATLRHARTVERAIREGR